MLVDPPLPGHAVTNLTFPLCANLEPPSEYLTSNSFTKTFELHLVPENADLQETILQFPMTFANRADYLLQVQQPSHHLHVGDLYPVNVTLNNHGFVCQPITNLFYVDGALMGVDDMGTCSAYKGAEFQWKVSTPGPGNYHMLSVQSVIQDNVTPFQRVAVKATVDPGGNSLLQGSLAGRVTSANTNYGIGNVQVTLFATFNGFCLPLTSTYTSYQPDDISKTGFYQFPCIAAGDYTVRYQARQPDDTSKADANRITELRNVTVGGGTTKDNPTGQNVILTAYNRAELVIGDGDVTVSPPSPGPRSDLTFSAAVHNVGWLSAQDVRVHFTVQPPVGDPIDLGRTNVSLILTGNQVVALMSWTSQEIGWCTVYATANDPVTVDEYYYDNNQGSATFHVGNHPPSVTLLSPVGGELWSGRQLITWGASDPDGDQVSFTLSLRDTANHSIVLTNLSPAMSDGSNFLSCAWDTAHLPGNWTSGSNYFLQIVANDGGGGWATNTSTAVFTIDNVPPVAQGTVAPGQNWLTLTPIVFTNTSHDALSGVVSNWWDFGDGGTSSQANPVWTYDDDHRTNTVRLTVTDGAGNRSNCTLHVNLLARPKANIDLVDPVPMYRGATMTMKGHGWDPAGRLAEFQWLSSLDGFLHSEPLNGSSATTTFTTAGLTDGNNELYLVVKNADGLTNDPVASSSVQIVMPPNWPMFHQGLTHVANASPTVRPKARPLMGNTYTKQWSFATGGPVESSPAVANLDGEFTNGLEIVVGSDDGHLYALSSLGVLLWKFPAEGQPPTKGFRSSPVCVDTDGDRKTWEHVAAGSDDGTLYVLNSADGSVAHQFTVGSHAAIVSSPAVADLRGDGQKEIVFGCDDGNVYCLTFPDCQFLWNFLTVIGNSVHSSPAIADLGVSLAADSRSWLARTTAVSTLWTPTATSSGFITPVRRSNPARQWLTCPAVASRRSWWAATTGTSMCWIRPGTSWPSSRPPGSRPSAR